MILLIHQNAEKGLKILREEEELRLDSAGLCELFWKLAEEYPQETLVWVEESLQEQVDLKAVKEILHHDLIMASYAVKTRFLPDTIGYIDQLPFVKVDRKVQYGTWQMSSDMGAIKAGTLLLFRPLFGNIRNFDFLLNSISKLGQQNGLFCYSAPNFSKSKGSKILTVVAKAGTAEVFQFVFSHYKSIRVLLLFWHYWKYEKSFSFLPLLKSLTGKKYFRKQVDFSRVEVRSTRIINKNASIDVIIPTMGRRNYLLQVMEDLKTQTLLPKKVVVVEQDPKEAAVSDLPELETTSWPFEIKHIFTHRTGACNARNLALDETDAEWVFFADDDNRMEADVLEKALLEIEKFGLDLLTLNYRQKGEPQIFRHIKQWGTFGAGNSILSCNYAKTIRFDPALEFGYGEDVDYGMQLRKAGCDIIYHPEVQILHLKAPRGGFREIRLQPWEKDKPKPSPTMMLLAKKYYSVEQMRGFRTELLLRYYPRQKIRNPFRYLKEMKKRWALSESWASSLMKFRVPAEKLTNF